MFGYEKDGDLECAGRAHGRARNENAPFAQALEEALREIEPEIAAGKFDPPRFLKDGFVARVAKRMKIKDNQARVLLGLAVHAGLLGYDDDVVLEDAVEHCGSRMDVYRFYSQTSPQEERGEKTSVSSDSREPLLGRQEVLKEPEELPEKAKYMAALVSRYAARCANQNPEVKAFRSAVLGGDLLSPGMLEEASRSGPLSLPGALAEADRLAATLSEAYGWDVEGARRFLLTGESPRFSPLTVEVTKKGSSREAPTEIRIVALAGTPARYVTSAYRWEQHKLLGKKDSRPLSEKGIELYEFVVDEEARAAAEGRELSHRELMDEWQRRHEHHPGYIYGDPRRFGRALRRVEGVARRHAGMGFSDEPMPERE